MQSRFSPRKGGFLLGFLAPMLLAGTLAAQAIRNPPHNGPAPIEIGPESRVSLALWAMQAVQNEDPLQTGDRAPGSAFISGVPEEVLALRGQIPDSCFQNAGGIQLVSGTSRGLPGRTENLPTGRYPLLKQQPSTAEFPEANPAPAQNQTLQGPGHSPLFNPHAAATDAASRISPDGVDPHLEVFAGSQYPSAAECAVCHQQIYDEWAGSSHAYAAVSPMFHAFEQTITKLSSGTVGYFCLRCHAPVATTMGADRTQPIWAGPRVFREGVTCVACHRVRYPYVKPNGERRIEPGNIHAPVFGTGDGTGNAVAIKYRDHFKVRTDPADRSPSQPIHQRVIQFEELRESTFCASCHQVAVQPGIKLEVVWDQYRGSPACREGVTCQDCHMGRVPGRNEGYAFGPAAVISEKAVQPERRHSNHTFFGPGYSIAHPGIFPFEKEDDRWSFNDWQQFDWRSGWGTREFETALAAGQRSDWFPPAWGNPDDRMDARQKIDRNLRRLELKRDLRRQVMENGSHLDGPFFACTPRTGSDLDFEYIVSSTNAGHNMPSGSLGAQPQLWVNVALVGPDGCLLWESGNTDTLGDLRDIHSADVTAGRVPLDRQLVNFQTRFLITNIKGTDREIPLPVNVDVDQLPFLRPPAQPTTVINHPPLIRMEAHSIPPLGSKRCRYTIPASAFTQPGTYRLSVRLRSRLEPMYFMRFCNSSEEMIRMMQEWTLDFHVHSVAFEVDP